MDLLRHDRVESFDRLAGQLTTEYDEKIRKKKLLDATKIDLIFNKFLKDALMGEKRILRGIQVDKTHRPFEEQIEFDMNSATSLKWLRRFSTEQPELGPSKLNEKLNLNIDEEAKLREQLDEERFQETITTTTTTTKTTTETKTTNLQQQTSETATNGTGECGVTPPPTPQNELINTNTNTKIVDLKPLIDHDDGSHRIVLNAVNEPPILFLSDLETENKPSKPIQVNLSTNEPVTSVEAAVSTLKKGEEVNMPSQGKLKKNGVKSKKSAGAFSCLSCAGGQAKFEDEEKPTAKKEVVSGVEEARRAKEEAKQAKAARKQAKKQLAVDSAGKSKSKTVVESRAKSPVRIETDLSMLNPPNTFVDVPTVISLDIQGQPSPGVDESSGKSPKSVKSAAKQTDVEITVVPPEVVVQSAKSEQIDVKVELVDETNSEKLFDASNFISLDTEEQQAVELADKVEIVEVNADVEEVKKKEEADDEKAAPIDEGPITPPTTPEIKAKSK